MPESLAPDYWHLICISSRTDDPEAAVPSLAELLVIGTIDNYLMEPSSQR